MKNNNGFFLYIIIILVAAIYCTPILGSSRNIVLASLIAGFYIITHYKSLLHDKIIIYSVLFYIAVIFGYRFAGFSDAEWGNYMHQLSFFLPLFLFMSFPKTINKTIFVALIIIVSANIVDNIRLSIIYPQLNTARVFMEEELLTSINAGGSKFYTSCLLFFDVCFFIFLNSKQRFIKYTMLISAIISAIYICGFCFKASVVVYFILSLVLIFYAKRAKNKFKFFSILIFSSLLLFLSVELFSNEIIDLIISISPNERLTTRLVTLIDPEDAESNVYTVTGRTNLYFLSVKTWLTDLGTFIFGIGEHRTMYGASETGIGQHSEFLDTLARYGLLGFVTVLVIFKNVFKKILNRFDKEFHLQIYCIITIFIMCGLTKIVFFPSIGFMLFLLLPLSAQYVNESNFKNRYER